MMNKYFATIQLDVTMCVMQFQNWMDCFHQKHFKTELRFRLPTLDLIGKLLPTQDFYLFPDLFFHLIIMVSTFTGF